MLKFFRLSAYVVLLTFILSLGDWPFVDELLADAVSQQQDTTLVRAADAGQPATKSSTANHSAAGLYQALSNFIDMPVHRLPPDVAICAVHVAIDLPPYFSADLPLLERPPRAFLS